jgi:uncharacterized membrane protein
MTDRARIEQRSDLVGAGLMSVTSLLFGTVIVIQKVATEFDLSAWWILSIRFGIAAAVLAALLIVLGQPLMSARRERLPLVILGAGAYGVEASFFFLALNHGTASTTTLLFFTYPAMVAVGSMLLGRGAPGWLLGGALICAVAGAALVVSSSGGLAIDAWGVAFALAAAVVFSLYLLGADHLIRETNPLTAAMWVSGAAADRDHGRTHGRGVRLPPGRIAAAGTGSGGDHREPGTGGRGRPGGALPGRAAPCAHRDRGGDDPGRHGGREPGPSSDGVPAGSDLRSSNCG